MNGVAFCNLTNFPIHFPIRNLSLDEGFVQSFTFCELLMDVFGASHLKNLNCLKLVKTSEFLNITQDLVEWKSHTKSRLIIGILE